MFFGCSKKQELSIKDKSHLINVIDTMYELDQANRLHLYQIDSIYNLDNLAFMNLKRQKKILDSSFEQYKKSIDSTWGIINHYDSINTKKLIAITNEFGFPNNKRLGVYKSKAFMIFVHSPQKFFPEVRSLITKEYNYQRISEYKKGHIFWHLNGRNGMPPRSGKNGEAVWQKPM